MSIEKLLEGLGDTDDAELEDTRFDLDILDDVLTGLPDTDEDGNPISSHLYADSIMEVYGIDRDELIELLKSSGRGLRFFDLSIEDMGSELVVGNSMCTEDDVRNDFLASLDGLEDIEFTVTEIVDDSSDDIKAATGTAPKEPAGPIVESTTVGPDSVFGYINGDLESFDPWSFVNKVRRRKMSLHTNRMVRDTDNIKVCHHIVCSVMGLGDKPSVYVDVVEETWERDTRIGDADSIDNYKGKMTQERILSKECGNGENGFNEAILVLEEYKEKTLKGISSGGHGGNHDGNASGDISSGSLTESKEDQQKFIDKFGQNVFNLFNKSKDRLKNANISTDILYHVKNTDVDDMKNILHNLQAKVVKTDGVGTDLTKIQGKYNFLGSRDEYDVYEPLDVIASMSLGVGSGWCTTGRYGHAGEVNFKPSLKDARKHWNQYTSKGVRFFYFLKDGIGKYALALYPRVLKVKEFINNDTYIESCNFELYNQEDNLDYKGLSKIPYDLIGEELVIHKAMMQDGLIMSEDGKTLIKANESISSCTIPNSVKYIDNDAFARCTLLTSVNIPDSVKDIGINAFYGCTSLTSVTISEGVEEIGYQVFSGCTSLNSIIIPDSVTKIGAYAFEDCNSLKSVIIPNSVKKIDDHAFEGCISLASLIIPDSVTSIGYRAFDNCPKLTIKTNNKYAIDYCNENNIPVEPLTENLGENMETDTFMHGEVEEDIEKHDTLNPKLFENDELKEDVREALKRVVDAFVADLRESDIDLAVKDAVIVGSNVNYNYTEDSDLDLHIIADSSKSSYPGEVLTLLYSAYRSIFNKNYDITIKGIPCEVYVELDETGTDSNGVYSLFSGWIRKPEHENVPDLDEEGFNKLFGEWEDRYFKLLDTLGVEPGELLATGC